MATLKPAPDPRIEAARYLAEAVRDVKQFDLLVNATPEFIESAYEVAITGHRTCACEVHVRLTRARDILLGIPPAAPGELRLLP